MGKEAAVQGGVLILLFWTEENPSRRWVGIMVKEDKGKRGEKYEISEQSYFSRELR